MRIQFYTILREHALTRLDFSILCQLRPWERDHVIIWGGQAKNLLRPESRLIGRQNKVLSCTDSAISRLRQQHATSTSLSWRVTEWRGQPPFFDWSFV